MKNSMKKTRTNKIELLILPISYTEPVKAFAQFAGESAAMFIDSAGRDKNSETNRYSYIAVSPFKIIKSSESNPFDELEKELRDFTVSSVNAPVPFVGGAVGFMSYELGIHLEKLPESKREDLGIPDMFFGFYDVITAFDVIEKKSWIISSGFPEKNHNLRSDRAKQRADWLADKILNSSELLPYEINFKADWQEETGKLKHKENIKKTIDYIYAGDIFQANITHRFISKIPSDISRFDIYRKLREINPAPFAAYIYLGEKRSILSASPERFLSLDENGTVETRPIKGTRPRGKTKDEDKKLALELVKSDKDKSENLMIVDLMRNDLSRVCKIGSVKTPELFRLESYETVHHLVSVVKGQLLDDKAPVDLLRATFAGGSITGAPKIRAMEIINELETSRRGVYCGSIMWIGFDKAMDSSIVIRTMVTSNDTIVAQAGGGITAESDPEMEYNESVDKVKALLEVLE